jgi:hypothetical protein
MKNFTLILCSLFLTITAFGQDLVINVTLCDDTANSVRIHGPWWDNWDPNGGPEAISNGDGTWKFTFSPAPAADMEYKILVNGMSEDLIGKGSCAAITDDATYANRQWKTSDPMTIDLTYNQCSECTTTNISNSLKPEGVVSVFPNPTTNYLNVSTTTDFKRLNIVNIYGSVVKDFRLVGNFNVLDLNGIAPGIYLVNAFSQDGVFTNQITVK